MPKNLMTLDIGTAACDVCQSTYNVAPIQPVQSGAEPRVKGATDKKTKKSYSATLVLLHKSKNRPKLEWAPDLKKYKDAKDFLCGDFTIYRAKRRDGTFQKGILDIFPEIEKKKAKGRKDIWDGLHSASEKRLGEFANDLFQQFSSTAEGKFAKGEMKNVIKSMINHMRYQNGADFTNAGLIEEVKKHKNTEKFIKQVKKVLQKHIVQVKGNVKELIFQGPSPYDSPLSAPIQKGVDSWNFKNDTFTGLKICINQVWGYHIYLKNYKSDGSSFTSTLYIDAYDHFGLDEADLKWYTKGDPFLQWFILQRWKGFDKKYKPFVTRIPIEETFNGEL